MQTSIQDLLWGSDPTPGLLAVEVGEGEAKLYRRVGGGVSCETREFCPWLVAEKQVDLPLASWHSLEGEGYAHLAEFASWSAFREAHLRLLDLGVESFSFASPVRQFLARTGLTLFKGLSLEDLRRMQLDIETPGLSPHPAENRIGLIALRDNAGLDEVLSGDEPDLLRRLCEVVQARDPDVIEGHNIYGFDLPFLARRAELLEVTLALGRDGSALRFGRKRRCAIGGASRPFTPAYLPGRHVIDTMLATQRFDAQTAQLESYSLKEAARSLGLSLPGRIHLNHDEIPALLEQDPQRVAAYARQDVEETARLAELTTATDFYLTQMVPDSYQNVAVTGTGEKINALLVREYLRRGKALARPQPARRFAGGYVEVRRTGLLSPVVKVDVESLYPSLMLSEGIKPASDSLDLFLPMLEELTRRRLEAKARAQSAPGKDRAYWDGLQGSFKVLINSFYGYLGSSFLFNDFEAAARVTRRGQQLVRQVADLIEERGGEVIEIDTDGVYFKPPPQIADLEQELHFVDEVGAALPAKIRLAHDGRYQAMISLKIKNYVCLGYDGKKVFRGASVRSRADEGFGRDFLARAMDLLFAGEIEGLSRCYHDLARRIQERRLPVEKLMRRERVTEKTFSSPAKRRAAEAARGVAVGEYVSLYQREDGSLALARDYQNDEDREYYLDKLHKFALRLQPAIGDDFDRHFPRLTSREAKAREAGQRTLGFE